MTKDDKNIVINKGLNYVMTVIAIVFLFFAILQLRDIINPPEVDIFDDGPIEYMYSLFIFLAFALSAYFGYSKRLKVFISPEKLALNSEEKLPTQEICGIDLRMKNIGTTESYDLILGEIIMHTNSGESLKIDNNGSEIEMMWMATVITDLVSVKNNREIDLTLCVR